MRRCVTWTLTARDPHLIKLVETYAKEQGMFRTDASPDPMFTDSLELDLASVVPSISGPRRPQDRIAADGQQESLQRSVAVADEEQECGQDSRRADRTATSSSSSTARW